MNKILSFRWSRLAKCSAWERLFNCLELFLIGFIMVGVVSIWWWNSCWMFGIPVIMVMALWVVCSADDFCIVAGNSYYFYKSDFSYIMEYHDYEGWHAKDVLTWEYENVSEHDVALLYCDVEGCWNIVSRQACIKLGSRLNKSSFLIDIPTICGSSNLRFVILDRGKLTSRCIRNVYFRKNLKMCFTKQEREALSEADLSAEYIIVQNVNRTFDIWRIKKDATSFFAAEPVKNGPSFVIRHDKRVSIWVWNSDVYRYQEVFSDHVGALGVSGRFVYFKQGRVPLYVTISEFNPESKKVEQIYEGFVSSLNFVTGEYTV